MARFRFRLQRVLDLREQVVGVRRLALAAALAREREAREHLDALEGEMSRRLQDLAAREREGATVAELAPLRRYLERLGQEREQARTLLEAARAEVARRRDELVRARQEARVLERLRERRLQQHRQDELRSEQALADDLVQSRLQSPTQEV
ncbi:flagellar export protein FliJ [Caldinitratiruptor microaerophilus]|uniref:Flagellar FliJ protein n=1 Tax=Caldinitratiruptor microaerophilus TaxID=671077 RepID=A0AA35CJ68_9FIRM|nr:flagellar export protein FliJ [Caldinitratiruptor microaerophilus]BDG59353.1 hypothetical protein caldi_04430 [Caldinitratiruptor microaerophilus]